MSVLDQNELLNGLQDIAKQSGLDISEELGKINAKLLFAVAHMGTG